MRWVTCKCGHEIETHLETHEITCELCKRTGCFMEKENRLCPFTFNNPVRNGRCVEDDCMAWREETSEMYAHSKLITITTNTYVKEIR